MSQDTIVKSTTSTTQPKPLLDRLPQDYRSMAANLKRGQVR